VKIKVHVWDEDGRTRHDFVDSLQTRIMVAAADSESTAHWTSFIMRARTRSLNISLYLSLSLSLSLSVCAPCTLALK